MTDISDLIAWRRMLHRQPDLSGAEAGTAQVVASRLAALQPDDLITGLGGHGVLARFCGAAPRLRVMLRCELDGLPIPETSEIPHRSEVPAQGHLCGHDGHMAIIMGVAETLAAARIAHADVTVLFQPAEETGAGAQAVLGDPRFAALAPDVALALHNLPGMPLGEVAVRAGSVSCASAGLRISLSGRTAHASQPETGLSPAGAMTEIITRLTGLNVPAEPGGIPKRMATVTHARLGEATFGVAPGEADVFVTLRAIQDGDMAGLRSEAEEIVSDVCAQTGVSAECTHSDVFHATVNDAGLAQTIRDAAMGASIPCHEQAAPMRWSEDFGRFGAGARSALFLLGAGPDAPALHDPEYDFPDAVIPVGMAMFLGCIERLAGQPR